LEQLLFLLSLGAPLLLGAAQLMGNAPLNVPLSVFQVGSLLAFQLFAFPPESEARVEWRMLLPHALCVCAICIAAYRRVSALRLADVRREEAFFGSVIPVAQAANLTVQVALVGSNRRRVWAASRLMMRNSGLIGLAGNAVLLLATLGDDKVRFTPGRCPFAVSVALWASFVLLATYTNEGRRRLFAFIRSSVSLSTLPEERLGLLADRSIQQSLSSHPDSDRPQGAMSTTGESLIGPTSYTLPADTVPTRVASETDGLQQTDGLQPLFAQLAGGMALQPRRRRAQGSAYNPRERVGCFSTATSSQASESAEAPPVRPKRQNHFKQLVRLRRMYNDTYGDLADLLNAQG